MEQPVGGWRVMKIMTNRITTTLILVYRHGMAYFPRCHNDILPDLFETAAWVPGPVGAGAQVRCTSYVYS